MRPLRNKHLHNFIRFSIGKANFRSINRLIQGSLTKHMGNLIKPIGKPDKGQSSINYNFQTNRLVPQILIFKSCPFFDFCGCAYCAVVSL